MGNDAALPVLSDAAETALQLLQAAVRAGDESADRSDPRRARDVARHIHRSAPEPAGRRPRGRYRGSSDATRSAAADPHERRHGKDPPCRALHRRRVPVLRTRHLLSGRLGRERHGGGAGVAFGGSGGCHSSGLQHPDRVRSQGVGRAAADSGAARDRGRSPAPGPQGPAHKHGSRGRNRVGARGASFRAARGLRRRGDSSVPRAGDAGNARRRGAARVVAGTRLSLHQGGLAKDCTR